VVVVLSPPGIAIARARGAGGEAPLRGGVIGPVLPFAVDVEVIGGVLPRVQPVKSSNRLAPARPFIPARFVTAAVDEALGGKALHLERAPALVRIEQQARS